MRTYHRVSGVVAGITTMGDWNDIDPDNAEVWYELWGTPIVVTRSRYGVQDNIGIGSTISVDYATICEDPELDGRVLADPTWPDPARRNLEAQTGGPLAGWPRTITVATGAVIDAPPVNPAPYPHPSRPRGPGAYAAASAVRIAYLAAGTRAVESHARVGDVVDVDGWASGGTVVTIVERTEGIGDERTVIDRTVIVVPIGHTALTASATPAPTTLGVDGVPSDPDCGAPRFLTIKDAPRDWIRTWLIEQGENPDDWDPDALDHLAADAFTYHDQEAPAGHYWRMNITDDELMSRLAAATRT